MRYPKPAFLCPAVIAAGLLASPIASAEQISARLDGFQESPSIVTPASGDFRASIHPGDDAITYDLSYSGLTGNVVMAHVHVAQLGVNGAVAFWLCGTEIVPGPPGTPQCPQEGTVGGMITADDVTGAAGQGIAVGDLEAVIRAIRAGATYVNVHSTQYFEGEIRGQIRASRR